MAIEIRTATLDGKRIAYTSETVFLVQSGLGKGKYCDRYRLVGNLGQAVAWYKGLNIRAPYKKRLIGLDLKPSEILARYIGT